MIYETLLDSPGEAAFWVSEVRLAKWCCSCFPTLWLSSNRPHFVFTHSSYEKPFASHPTSEHQSNLNPDDGGGCIELFEVLKGSLRLKDKTKVKRISLSCRSSESSVKLSNLLLPLLADHRCWQWERADRATGGRRKQWLSAKVVLPAQDTSLWSARTVPSPALRAVGGSVSGPAGDPVEVDVVLGKGDAGGSRLAPPGEVELQVDGHLVAQEHVGYPKETHKKTKKMHQLAKRRNWETYSPDWSKLSIAAADSRVSVICLTLLPFTVTVHQAWNINNIPSKIFYKVCER